jgi:DNA-binding Lrp family transcriptional regulator
MEHWMPIAYILLNCSLGEVKYIIECLSDFSQIREVYSIFGVSDIFVKIDTETFEEINNIIKDIRGLYGIEMTTTLIADPELGGRSALVADGSGSPFVTLPKVGKTAYVFIHCIIGKNEAIINELLPLREVLEVRGVLGVYDIFVKVRGNTDDETYSIINNKIRKINGVKATTTFISEPQIGGRDLDSPTGSPFVARSTPSNMPPYKTGDLKRVEQYLIYNWPQNNPPSGNGGDVRKSPDPTSISMSTRDKFLIILGIVFPLLFFIGMAVSILIPSPHAHSNETITPFINRSDISNTSTDLFTTSGPYGYFILFPL